MNKRNLFFFGVMTLVLVTVGLIIYSRTAGAEGSSLPPPSSWSKRVCNNSETFPEPDCEGEQFWKVYISDDTQGYPTGFWGYDMNPGDLVAGGNYPLPLRVDCNPRPAGYPDYKFNVRWRECPEGQTCTPSFGEWVVTMYRYAACEDFDQLNISVCEYDDPDCNYIPTPAVITPTPAPTQQP